MRISVRTSRHSRVSMGPVGWILAGPFILCWYMLLFELLLMWWMLKLSWLGIAALCAAIGRAWASNRAPRHARPQPQSFYSTRR